MMMLCRVRCDDVTNAHIFLVVFGDLAFYFGQNMLIIIYFTNKRNEAT